MAKANQESPTIELYMYSLHQEFPEGVSHASFLKRQVETRDILAATGEPFRNQRVLDVGIKDKAGDWPAQWLHAKWVTDHTKAMTGMFERPDVSPIQLALTRSESFGGIVYDPFSDKVYKVNESGLRLFRELQGASKIGSVAKFKSSEFAEEDVKMFSAFLKGADLWER